MCMVDSCDGYFTVLTDCTRKAKKPHKCCECGRVIATSEIYNYQAGVSVDNDFTTFKTCQHCLIPRKFIQIKCGGFVYQEVRDDLREHTHVPEWGYRAARAYVGMRRRWKSFKTDGLLPLPVMELEA